MRRLFLFIKDTNNKTDNCNDNSAKLEEYLPSHIHRYHLPRYRGRKKKISTSSSKIEKVTALRGILRVIAEAIAIDIISRFSMFVNNKKLSHVVLRRAYKTVILCLQSEFQSIDSLVCGKSLCLNFRAGIPTF